MTPTTLATLLAGVSATDNALFRRLRFQAFDHAAVIDLPGPGGVTTTVICRDIEIPRAKEHARADAVYSPADVAPAGGLSADRDVATAQAAAEFLRRAGVRRVTCGRSLPALYVSECAKAGVAVECDAMLGVMDRRHKQAWEVEALREAQRVTERAIEMACRVIARASARSDGVLMDDGRALTSEGLNTRIDVWLLERGFTTPGNIVAQAPHSFDCHHAGAGELRTGLPVIVDVFPRSRSSRFNGDCTRTVVHGRVPGEVARMHAAVVAAKGAALRATGAGVPADSVHRAAMREIEAAGYSRALPPPDAGADFCSMQHGTGHGIGLDLKEPPLVEVGGPELVEGDAVTLEPGLYHKTYGGIRVEDMVIVRQGGCENLNRLPEGLGWE